MAGSKKVKTPEATNYYENHEDTGTSSKINNDTASENTQEDTNQIRQGIATERIAINREEYLQAYRDLLNESQHLQIRNNILHRRLAEYYRKRRLEHVLKTIQNTVDLEEKYQQKLISYEELKEKTEREMIDIRTKISVAEDNVVGQLESAEKKFQALQNLERSTGSGLIYSRTGKPIADKTVTRFITLQAHKSEQASTLTLRYIRARNTVAELEADLRKLETLGPGLYVHQYEQLNIDNRNLKNKIEEREDELIRNRLKCTGHSHILAHIREKMDHVEELIDIAECDYGESEIKYSSSRETLGSVKATRNRLRWLLEAEYKTAGLLTRKDLLLDYRTAADEVMALRKTKETLKAQLASTSQQLSEAQKNINF